MIKLHNNLSNRLEPFQPANQDEVTIYSCGPTVYDHVHIGNLSAFIMADTLRRTLKIADHKVNHVMNITDIDDKTAARSHQEYPDKNPKEALQTLTGKYEQIFTDDMAASGNDISSFIFVKATDSILQIQKLIKNLLADGFAYVADDGVYFSIAAYKKSGKKYGQLVKITESSTSQARIDNDEYDKASAHDFALWKKQKPNEPAWDFEIDGKNLKGRPGWHIECSAMSTQALGQPFDIHTGGVDLKFPHHENEIAQSTAGKKDSVYARFFLHNEHILVDGKKMAKSANNFFTLQDVKKKGFDPLAFRLLILQSHYRSQAHFSWENLKAAQNRLEAFHQAADMVWQVGAGQNIQYHKADIQQALEDDLATPQALAIVNTVFSNILSKGVAPTETEKLRGFLSFVDAAFGLQLNSTADINTSQKELITKRETARKNQDWSAADELRETLEKQGIAIRDTSYGTVWWRIYKSKT